MPVQLGHHGGDVLLGDGAVGGAARRRLSRSCSSSDLLAVVLFDVPQLGGLFKVLGG
jgi:hypothetical protein